MPDPRYPAAVWRPGVNADNGQTTMETAVCHFTVGRDSRPVGDRGFFQFLVSRDGTVTQFARADAVCWHAGTPWNQRGPGIEIEYLPSGDDDLWTPEQEAATGLLCQWLEDEWHIPLEFYDGPRRSSWHGFITHRSLIQSGDPHSDWWPYLPTAAPAPTPTPPAQEDSGSMWALLALHPADNTSTYLCGVGSAIIHDLHGKQRDLGLPMDEIRYVGWEAGGVTTKTVSSKTIENLRAAWPNVGDQG